MWMYDMMPNDEWTREMQAYERNRVIEDRRAAGLAMERDRRQALEDIKNYKAAVATRVLEEKRAMKEEQARQQFQAKMALQQARADAIAQARANQWAAKESKRRQAMEANAAIRNAMAEAAYRNAEEKRRAVTERDIEAARANAFFQARAASIAGGYRNEFNNEIQRNLSNFDSADIQKNQYPSYLNKDANMQQNRYLPNENEQQNTNGSAPPVKRSVRYNYGNVPSAANQQQYKNGMQQYTNGSGSSMQGQQQYITSANQQQSPYSNTQSVVNQQQQQQYSNGIQQYTNGSASSMQNQQQYNTSANQQQNPYSNTQSVVNQQQQQQYNKGIQQYANGRQQNTYSNTPTMNNQQQSAYGNSVLAQNQQQYINRNVPPLEVLNNLLDTAISAAIDAGQIIRENMNSTEVSKVKANSRNVLAEIGPRCEKVIKDMILKKFPDHEFLEEEQRFRNGSNDYSWIVDPIDGTSNFVHGMPLCMCSIACSYKGQTIVSVIFDPHRKEIFTAVKGYGARMNGDIIQVGQQATIGDAIIGVGLPKESRSMEMSLRGIQKLTPQCRTIRILGSTALMMAWVANGRLTAYWEYDLNRRNIAAGALLISEAGGKITDSDYSLTTRKICGSNGLVHDALNNILSSAGVY
jgi:myo-inositol-1(or 4)-monophosphatase